MRLLRLCWQRRQLLLRATRGPARPAQQLAEHALNGPTQASIAELADAVCALREYAQRVTHSKVSSEWLDAGAAEDFATELAEWSGLID